MTMNIFSTSGVSALSLQRRSFPRRPRAAAWLGDPRLQDMSSSLLSRLRCAVRHCSPVNAHPLLAGRPVFPTERPRVRAFRREAGDGADPPVSLQQCYGIVTSAKCECEWQQLEDLPPSMLLKLLKRCAEERDEFKASNEARGTRLQQLEHKEARRYKVDPPFSGKRVGEPEGPWPSDPLEQEVQQAAYYQRIAAMERLLEDVRSKWQTQPVEGLSPEDQDFRRPYSTKLLWSVEERRFTLVDSSIPYELALYRIMSSALLLYRACCLFESVDVNTSDLADRYKCVWEVRLWHTATGRELCLDEHKGAAGVDMQWPSVEDKQLSSDFLQLMNLLYGQCPHTYDWTLAGSAA